MAILSRCGSAAAVRVGDSESIEKEDQKKHKMNDAMTSWSSSCSGTALTVWRKSLLFACNGFTVIDSAGNLIYRVDNYRGDRNDDIVLMDASGNPLFTLRRKKRRFLDNWLVFEGEAEERDGKEKKPICWVKKHVNLLLQRNQQDVVAQVFGGSSSSSSSSDNLAEKEKGNAIFAIQGSYERRSCQVVDGLSREVVAEIKRKDANIRGISYGHDVFLLVVRSGFDPAFAMSLVLLLDQMFT